MTVIQPHRIHSRKVEKFSDIGEDAEFMDGMLRRRAFLNGQVGLSLHHSQLRAMPYNFFVVHEKLSHFFDGIKIIINPKVLHKEDMRTTEERCLSYPFRGPKKVLRYHKVTFEFDYVDFKDLEKGEFKHKIMEVKDLGAFIVQHELDHAHGKYIYD